MAGEAQVQVQGQNFILAFDDDGDGTPDSQVVFNDMVTLADAGEAPAFQVAGVNIGADVLIGQALPANHIERAAARHEGRYREQGRLHAGR